MCISASVFFCLSVCITVSPLTRDTCNPRQTFLPLGHSTYFLPILYLKKWTSAWLHAHLLNLNKRPGHHWAFQARVIGSDHGVVEAGTHGHKGSLAWSDLTRHRHVLLVVLFLFFFSQQTYLISVLETSQALYLSSLKSEPQMKKMGWYTHSKLFNDWLKLWHCKSNRVATIGLLICVK